MYFSLSEFWASHRQTDRKLLLRSHSALAHVGSNIPILPILSGTFACKSPSLCGIKLCNSTKRASLEFVIIVWQRFCEPYQTRNWILSVCYTGKSRGRGKHTRKCSDKNKKKQQEKTSVILSDNNRRIEQSSQSPNNAK